MKTLAILVAAIVLIIVGTKGTYANVWNKLFPNYPLTVAPPQAVPQLSNVLSQTVQQAATAVNNAASNPTYNPVAAGSQAGTSARNWISGVLSGAVTGGVQGVTPSNTATGTVKTTTGKTIVTGGGVYGVESVGRGKQTELSSYTPPSWWPSWLPYWGEFGWGPAQTGQQRNSPESGFSG